MRVCGARCFTCSQGMGECAAVACKKMSPKTIRGAKQCTICSVVMLVIAVGLIVQAFIVPAMLHKDVRQHMTMHRPNMHGWFAQ
jgi:hypothetical protein